MNYYDKNGDLYSPEQCAYLNRIAREDRDEAQRWAKLFPGTPEGEGQWWHGDGYL